MIMDFEQADINAVTNTIGPHIHIQACFYHLTQSTWRKIQSMGLVTLYHASEDVQHFYGMLDGVTFLSVDCVVNGLQFLKENIPDGLETLLEYSECAYVSGSFRRIQPPPFLDGTIPPLCMHHVPPLYPPTLWNVNETTLKGEARINNQCDTWNCAFAS